MIISHKHKFIFFRTRKTAGSSLQVALSEHCGEDDVITGQCKSNFTGDVGEAGLNTDQYDFPSHNTRDPHTTLRDVKRAVGSDVWNSYFKFAFVRNPYEIAVSRYFWNKRGKFDKKESASIDGFRDWVKNGSDPSVNTWNPLVDQFKNYICDGGAIDIDFVGMYENLEDDISYICEKLNLPELDLPKLKGGYRDPIPFATYYDIATTQIVDHYFRDDIQLFGYTFSNSNLVSKRPPIIFPSLFENENDNINNPSVIRVPEWVINAKGKYYCYFSNHHGKSIKLAYTNNLNGEWTVVDDVFNIKDSPCIGHIASPELYVDNETNKLLMYYHGDIQGGQKTFLATSDDGVTFTNDSDTPLCEFYLRIFEYKGHKYGIAKKGNECSIVYDVDDGFTPVFEFLPSSRHCATYVKGDTLYVLYTNIGDAPEHIRVCKVALADEVTDWQVTGDSQLVSPTFRYEGAALPNITSMAGSAHGKFGNTPIKEIRDPYLFEDGGKLYVYYAILGEKGISWGRVINLE